jgi:hypothetical protein
VGGGASSSYVVLELKRQAQVFSVIICKLRGVIVMPSQQNDSLRLKIQDWRFTIVGIGFGVYGSWIMV